MQVLASTNTAAARVRKLQSARAIVALGAFLFAPVTANAADPWPIAVTAVYKVGFNGFEIGNFEFKSTVEQQNYTLNGNAELEALLGVFKWKGLTHSTGVVSANTPKPNGYNFFYKSSSKSGSVNMKFTKDAITNVTTVPQNLPSPKVVPVLPEHMKSVFDPLSAIMALSRDDGSKPCSRKVSIFDGKQRFDLAFSWRRQELIKEEKASGQPGVSFVCGVKYIPVAGYKLNDETKALMENDGIEIAFRPVPSAGLLVPHLITIPTYYGTATLTARKVAITTPDKAEIALIN